MAPPILEPGQLTTVKGHMEAMTLLLRFIFGVILAGGLVLWRGGLPFWASAIFVMAVGIIATIWGDRFLLGFMALFRYLR